MNLEQIYKERNAQKRVDQKNDKGDTFGLFERERADIFKKWIGTDKQIFELGCRNGSLTRWFAPGNTVLGLDIDKESLDNCKIDRVTTRQVDLNGDWGVSLGIYDIVVASEVIEHLYYPDQVIKKIHGLLKPGGYIIGSVPNAFNIKNRIRLFLARKEGTPLSEPTHITQFSYGEVKELLEKNFIEVEIIPVVQARWMWFARLFPGLGSFLIVFRAKKNI